MQEDPNELRTVSTSETEPVVTTKQNSGVSKLAQVIEYIGGLLVALLLVRFILALLGANLANAFASFIYSVTDPMVAPFRGLLQISQFQAGVSRFEIETLLTALVYALVTWGIVRLILLARK